MFKTVLTAIKFNEAGRKALMTAADIVRCMGGRLVVLHALDYSLGRLPDDAPERVQAKSKAEELFNNVYAEELRGLGNVDFHAVPGDPALTACRLARDLPADLVVFGCHQKKNTCLRSRVDYVGMTIMENAPCPVMLVPHVA